MPSKLNSANSKRVIRHEAGVKSARYAETGQKALFMYAISPITISTNARRGNARFVARASRPPRRAICKPTISNVHRRRAAAAAPPARPIRPVRR
ncbi:unnamed protein product, partial [Iphiclides podalirius]